MFGRFYTAQPQQQLAKPFDEPPPVQGMDGTVPLRGMPPGVAVYLYNLMPSEYGNQTREGYATWAQNLAGVSVRTILPFSGQQGDGTDSRLFAVTPFGIYDITAQGEDNPVAVVTFPNQGSGAGFMSYLHSTDPAGRQTLLAADSTNGMYEYTPLGDVWTKLTTEITGVDPTKVAFIMSHKGRIWMIESDSSDAWYLPVGQKSGQATRFQFGSKLRHGGLLVGLFPWTIDGGDGVDDYLLAVSKAGDVLAYRGSDPASAATWSRVGNWFIGEVPTGRRIAIENGGDSLLLSAYGLTSVSSLLQGISPNTLDKNITGKITRLIRQQMLTKSGSPFWEVKVLAEEGSVVINSPTAVGAAPIQYVLNLNRLVEGSGGGWGLWRGVPANTFEGHQGQAFFGAEDGKVYRMSGSLDAVGIDGQGGSPVKFSMLGRFSSYDAPGEYKQVQFLRPTFITSNQMNYEVKAIYDFALAEIVGQPTVATELGGQWDISNWDEAVWSGIHSVDPARGAGGYGRNVAVAIKGEVITRSTLVNIEGNWVKWGFL